MVSQTRVISLLAVLLLAIAILFATLITLGVFDPLPEGEIIWQMEPALMHISPQASDVRWLHDDPPQSPFMVQISARLDSGEPDSAYGLLLGHDGGTIAVLISPLGYTAVEQRQDNASADSTDDLLPWQTWPHVRTGSQANEITAIADRDRLTLRINREWLWESTDIEEIERVGIIGESFGGDAAIDFQLAELLVVDSSK